MIEDRYERLRQLDWWKFDLVSNAIALVAGGGALGNEVIKNLLLLGWGKIIVVDFDNVETNNLTKSILFTNRDIGHSKATSIAKNARRINPDCKVLSLHGDIRLLLSSGIIARCDMVFGCLDNVSARLSLNTLTRQAGKPYIDGGLSIWDGAATCFWPTGDVCYACTITEDDIKDLNLRRSCSIYAQKVDASRGVPTTPVVASVIGAFMVQHALKWLHSNTGIENHVRIDMAHDRIWAMNMPHNPDCRFHSSHIIPEKAIDLRIIDSWKKILFCVQEYLGSQVSIRLPIPVMTSAECPKCNHQMEPFSVCLPDAIKTCPECSTTMIPNIINQITGDEEWLDNFSPKDFKYPPFTWLTTVSEDPESVFELSGGAGKLKSFIAG